MYSQYTPAPLWRWKGGWLNLPNVSSDPNKTRLNLEVPRSRDQLNELVVRSGASSLTEVIRRALALYDLVLEHSEEDGKMVLRHKDGREEVLRII